MGAENKSKKSGVSKLVLLIPAAIVVLVITLLLLRTFIVSVVVVSGGSMEPEMQQGEKWLINRLDKSCDRGDVVVYKFGSESENLSVSRVIAVGGDTVYIDFSSGYVYVNGRRTDEYTTDLTKIGGEYISSLIESGRYGMSEPIIIENNKIFVMGDNRNNSRDSREFGQISVSDVCGTIARKLK